MFGNLVEIKRFLRRQFQFTISTMEQRSGFINAGRDNATILEVFIDRKLNNDPITIIVNDVDSVRPNLNINQDVLGANDSVTSITLGAIEPTIPNGLHDFIITGTDSKGRTFDRTVVFSTDIQPA